MHHGNAVRTNRLSVYSQCLDLLIVFCYTFLYLVIDTCRENRKKQLEYRHKRDRGHP